MREWQGTEVEGECPQWADEASGDVWALVHHSCAGWVSRGLCWAQTQGLALEPLCECAGVWG